MTAPTSARTLARDVALTALTIVAVLACAELGFRQVLPNLSANSRTLAAAPERAERIATSERPTILILGNSISGDGIDPTVLVDAFDEAGAPATIAHQPADTTVMRDWYYEYRNLFVERGAQADWLVLPVGDAAPLTRVNARTEDLMFSFLGWGDLPELYRRGEEQGFEEACGLVAARASALYGFRGRMQKRLFVAIAPRYEELRLTMRSAGATFSGEDEVSTDASWARSLADLARENGTRVVVVAMPTNVIHGRLPADAMNLAQELGWAVLEPGAEAEWSDADRPDGLHLEAEARARFSALLAAELVPLVVEAE